MADQNETGANEKVYGIEIYYRQLIVKKDIDSEEYDTEIWCLFDENWEEPYDFEKFGREGFWTEHGSLSESGKGTFVCPAQILRIEDPFAE